LFQFGNLTGVPVGGFLVLLMTSNSPNGLHLLSFYPTLLAWWNQQRKKREKHFYIVWNYSANVVRL